MLSAAEAKRAGAVQAVVGAMQLPRRIKQSLWRFHENQTVSGHHRFADIELFELNYGTHYRARLCSRGGGPGVPRNAQAEPGLAAASRFVRAQKVNSSFSS